MKRILIISSEFPPGPGGIGRHAADISEALTNQNYIIDVFSTIDHASKDEYISYKATLPSSINLYRLERNGWKTYINRINIILKSVKLYEYDRIILTGMFSLWIGGLLKLIYHRRLNVNSFIHGSELRPQNSIQRFSTQWSLSKSDTIWAVSNFTASLVSPKIKKRKKIHILPNGIHVKKWEEYLDAPPFKDWKGYPKLLTVGNVSPRKGQHRVIKALPLLIKNYPNIHYHVVGLDKDASALFELSKALNVEKYVTVHGRLPSKNCLARAYKTADIFIMLSENQPNGDVEGFGIALLEANYFRLPTIGAKGCGIEDAIQVKYNGEIVDGNNSQDILGALNKIVNNNEFYKTNAREWAENHDWNRILEDFIS